MRIFKASGAPLLLLGTLCAASQVAINIGGFNIGGGKGDPPAKPEEPITKLHQPGYCAIRKQVRDGCFRAETMVRWMC